MTGACSAASVLSVRLSRMKGNGSKALPAEIGVRADPDDHDQPNMMMKRQLPANVDMLIRHAVAERGLLVDVLVYVVGDDVGTQITN